MYENQTYQGILRRMLDKVDEWARERGISVDTREGSLIRTALSPAALEMLRMYIELDQVLNESFADTETRDFLIRRCQEQGISPEPATFAIRRGEFNMDVPLGARFSLNKLNYVVTEQIAGHAYKLRCETPGIAGNLESGDLVPIEYIDGLTNAVLTDVLIPGEDEESTEHLRQRYFASLESQSFGGNAADYREKALSLDGVGGVKVYPAWNGGGTVKLVILDSQFQIPSQTLVDAVQTAIDPAQNQGDGLGLAPIGHVVTVAPAVITSVNIETLLTCQAGWDWASVKPYLEAAVDAYFGELAAQWDASSALVVRISQIETRFLGLEGILDVQDTTLNGAAQNLILDADSIPERGTVNSV